MTWVTDNVYTPTRTIGDNLWPTMEANSVSYQLPNRLILTLPVMLFGKLSEASRHV